MSTGWPSDEHRRAAIEAAKEALSPSEAQRAILDRGLKHFEDVAELVKAARAMDEAMQAFCKHPGPVEDGSLFAAHRGLQAALRPFTREA